MRLADFVFDAPRSTVAAAKPNEARSGETGSIVSRFAAIAAARGDRTAVVDETGALGFAELEADANRIARLLHRLGLKPEARVGVMIGRRCAFITAALGVLKAGCTYVPIDPTLPLERRRQMLALAGAKALIVDAARAGDLRRLQWQCPALEHGLCLDHDDFDAVIEPPGAMMSTELWDHLAGDGADDTGAGGWKSAFTGEPIPDAAMAAFGANARRKAEALLLAGGRVLEVGCASGFTMRQVAPLATAYTACDLSRRNAERVETTARRLGLTHVTGRHLAAHDIDVLPGASFDLIIFNSVIENFPGFGYLRDVLNKAVGLLRPGGALYLGSLWDLDRRATYLADLAGFARAHAGEGYSTRLEFSETLFVPTAFFHDWAAERPERPSLEVSAIEAPGFDPAPYGFDLVLRFDGRGRGVSGQHRSRLDRRALLAESPEPPSVSIEPGQAAYLLFTGGTNGRPRGVVVEHGPVLNLAREINRDLGGAEPIERPLSLGCLFSFSFEGSIQPIFTALLNGHTLHIPDEHTKANPRLLHEYLERHQIDVCDATPGLLDVLVYFWHENDLSSSVRTFMLGSEVVPAELMRRFYALPGHRDSVVFNQYGPTEACVVATRHRMTAAGWQEHVPPPIGTPLPGVTIKVRDAAGRALPPGVPGELWIGGAGLARGYLDDTEETARRFVTAEGGRWYRTGDLVRQVRADLFAFLGREDRQVKIRGCRVEPAEVEAALTAHPLVRQAVVIPVATRGKEKGGSVLAAYVVPRPGFDPARCRSELDAILPAWMVPSRVITLDALPLTATGKLDERRLPLPGDVVRQSHLKRPPGFPSTGFAWSWPNDGRIAVDG